MPPHPPLPPRDSENPTAPEVRAGAKPRRFGAPFEIVEPPRLRFEGSLQNRLNLAWLLGWAWTKKHWLISCLVLLVGACQFMTRDRTLTWEEEVVLNTGDVIWVTRALTYKYETTHDNPFFFQYWPLGMV
jgi:hypothetical protein